MSDTSEFTIGSDVACSDGICGELTRVVVDPVARALTHLVVEPKDGRGQDRLVPVDLVDSAGDEVRLRCSTAEFGELENAEETQFLPGASGKWDYSQDQMLSWPYYGLGMGGMGGMGMGGMTAGMGMGMAPVAHTITRDRVPAGDIEVRRGEHVHASDGDIGRVQGLVIDPADHHVSHVLLEEGHLWGKKEVAIPIVPCDGRRGWCPAQPHEGRGGRAAVCRARPRGMKQPAASTTTRKRTPSRRARNNEPGPDDSSAEGGGRRLARAGCGDTGRYGLAAKVVAARREGVRDGREHC